MEEARRLSALSQRGAVYADFQSAGRGRLSGRNWNSAPGAGLTVTLWLPMRDFAGTPPSLVAGLILRSVLLEWAHDAGTGFPRGIDIKWPNDLLCSSSKISGILCEAAGDTVYVGMGVNCAQTSFEGQYRRSPSSIVLETGICPGREDLLARLVRGFSGMDTLLPHWQARMNDCLAWRGATVGFSAGIGGSFVHGVLEGVDAAGSLVLLIEGRRESCSSGELSLIDGARLA